MSSPSVDIKEWIQHFVNVNSSDQEVFAPANAAICEKLNSDAPFLIGICCQILMIEDTTEENIIKAQSLSSILLCNMLNIQSEQDLKFNRENLGPDLIKPIENALKQNIFSPNSTIRNKCAQCYSLLFATLTTNWQDGINNVVNSFSNKSLLPYGFIGLISIMREIVNQITFISEIVGPFLQHFTQTFVFCMEILKQEEEAKDYIIDIRLEACQYLHDIISVYPEILYDEGQVSIERIESLLDSLSNSLKIDSIELYSRLHQLLFILVNNYYRESPSFMETISMYIENGLNLYSTKPTFSMCSIFFWKQVSQLESSIIEKVEIDEKLNRKGCQREPLSPLLVETVLDKIIPILVNIMKNIDEKDTAVEDVQENPEPSMHATVTIQSFYNICPKEVFELIRSSIVHEIEEEKEGQVNWTRSHFLLSMIYSIIEDPVNDIIADFVTEYYDKIIDFAQPTQVPRLKETALFVLGLIIKNYPKVVTEVDSDNRIKSIINLIQQTLELDEQQTSSVSSDDIAIFSRYAMLIYYLSSAWKEHSFDSQISKYFDDLYDILGILFNIGILNSDMYLIQHSSEALNQLIFNSTPDLTNRLKELYRQTLGFLDRKADYDVSPEINYMIQSSFCSNISTLLLKLRKNLNQNQDIIEELAPATLEILYKLLSVKSTDLYEEGLMAVSALVNATRTNSYSFELFTQESFNRLIQEFIYNGLTSLNPGVINASCLLIGNLYYFLSSSIPDLLQAIPDIFETLCEIILEHKDMRDSHPFILKAIADIFNYSVFPDGQKPELEQQLPELLTKIYDTSTELDISDENDVEYGNLFYQYLSDAFTGYAKVYYEREDLGYERDQLFMLDKLAFYIWKLSPKINENLYLSFMKTAKQFAEHCSRRNNVILNRHSVHRILKFAYENSRNQDFKKQIKETVDFLKSR